MTGKIFNRENMVEFLEIYLFFFSFISFERFLSGKYCEIFDIFEKPQFYLDHNNPELYNFLFYFASVKLLFFLIYPNTTQGQTLQ